MKSDSSVQQAHLHCPVTVLNICTKDSECLQNMWTLFYYCNYSKYCDPVTPSHKYTMYMCNIHATWPNFSFNVSYWDKLSSLKKQISQLKIHSCCFFGFCLFCFLFVFFLFFFFVVVFFFHVFFHFFINTYLMDTYLKPHLMNPILMDK